MSGLAAFATAIIFCRHNHPLYERQYVYQSAESIPSLVVHPFPVVAMI